MKILLEIPDNRTGSLLNDLQDISYLKTTTLTESKATLIKEIKEAVDEVTLIRAGKKTARNAEDFLNEL
jgi:3-deoxy-D-manno-octulosonate 8-phosphate phosphatase KdsC-like HAD superfamily phosphatase